MDTIDETFWESLNSLPAASCSSALKSGDDGKDCLPNLADLFDNVKDDSYFKKASEVDFYSKTQDLANIGEDLNMNDFNWLDQKINLDDYFDAFQGDIVADEPIVFPDVGDTLLSALDQKQISSPCPTIETDIGSSPSSPEQFVPIGHNTFISPPESPVHVQFNLTGDLGTSVAFKNTVTTPTTISTSEDVLFSFLDPETSNIEIDTVEPIIAIEEADAILKEETQNDVKRSAKAPPRGVTKRTAKKPKRQVRVLDPSDRKQRKKGQNKTAATRYRQKKRVLTETLHHEKTNLEEVNAELHSKVSSISSEILYLKRLLREAFVAKGLINTTHVAPK